MKQKLVLENSQGEVVRTFWVTEPKAELVWKKAPRRVELVPSLESLKTGDYEHLATVEAGQLGQGLKIPGFGCLKALEMIEKTVENIPPKTMHTRGYTIGLVLFAASMLGLMITLVAFGPERSAERTEEIKVQVVQIIKKIQLEQPKVQTVPLNNAISTNRTVENQKTVPTSSRNVKRLGALAVLGSLKNGSQKGGLNLGAVQTSPGIGLGGSGGSGGIQSSLYAKGIVSAPLGTGGNIQGAGGYGTKGKGGGQAGYGSLSLVGSNGTSALPVGGEALVEGGLERDAIAAVVQRNMGQIRFCYEQGLQLDPSIAGRVVADWVINGQGSVVEPKISNTSMGSQTVEDCIVMRLRSWKFPLPKGGVNVKVSYPFVLKRVGT